MMVQSLQLSFPITSSLADGGESQGMASACTEGGGRDPPRESQLNEKSLPILHICTSVGSEPASLTGLCSFTCTCACGIRGFIALQ